MATPTYKGVGQPVANGGFLSGLGSMFSVSAPNYAPAPTKLATSAASTSGTSASVGAPERITLVIPRYVIESQQIVAYPSQDGEVSSCDAERITLVIPRSLIQMQQ